MFFLYIVLKICLTKGCIKNNCVSKANGKLSTTFCNQNGTKLIKKLLNDPPYIPTPIIPLYKIVAKKLIKGHIIHTVVHIIAVSTITGWCSLGFIALSPHFTDSGLPINISQV